MNDPVVIKMIGAPIACQDGIQESWRAVANWAAGQLSSRYGDRVQMRYYDLFDPDCPPLLPDSQLPVVLVNDQLLSSGEKISIPRIRKTIEALGVIPLHSFSRRK